MKKKQHWTLGIIVIVIIAIIFSTTVFEKHDIPLRKDFVVKQMVFFYGKECPHCKKAEAFIKEHSLHKKLNFVEKEVYHNRDNMLNLIYLAKKCDAKAKTVALPFLWTGKTCLVGNEKVIEFFEGKINEKN